MRRLYALTAFANACKDIHWHWQVIAGEGHMVLSTLFPFSIHWNVFDCFSNFFAHALSLSFPPSPSLLKLLFFNRCVVRAGCNLFLFFLQFNWLLVCNRSYKSQLFMWLNVFVFIAAVVGCCANKHSPSLKVNWPEAFPSHILHCSFMCNNTAANRSLTFPLLSIATFFHFRFCNMASLLLIFEHQ